jgi:uncharacterized protein (DUF4415 family)
MNNPEINSTDKIFEFETTENDVKMMRESGISEDEIPPIGIRRYRRARHIVKSNEAKLKVTMYLDMDVISHFKQRAESPNAAPYQTQINAELRKIMDSEKSSEINQTAETIENEDIIIRIADRIAEKLNEKKAA